MIKFTISIKDDKNGNCKVTLQSQKDLSKATENEKITGSNIYNTIIEALHNLEK